MNEFVFQKEYILKQMMLLSVFKVQRPKMVITILDLLLVVLNCKEGLYLANYIVALFPSTVLFYCSFFCGGV